MKPNQDRDVYYIPPNFLTSGRLFGGAIRIRNAIEAGILVVLTGLPIIQLPLSLSARIIILCLITLPLGIFGVIGIEGDALSEFLIAFIKWLKNRRKTIEYLGIKELAEKQVRKLLNNPDWLTRCEY